MNLNMRFPLSKSCQMTPKLPRHVFYVMYHKNRFQAYWKVHFLIFQHTLIHRKCIMGKYIKRHNEGKSLHVLDMGKIGIWVKILNIGRIRGGKQQRGERQWMKKDILGWLRWGHNRIILRLFCYSSCCC